MWFRIRNKEGLERALVGIRAQSHLTQADVAEKLHVDRATVIRMENGSNKNMARLVNAFSVVGYDLIAVPRDAVVTVESPEAETPELNALIVRR
jgi:DNA-binding XRE family transcriptional regulator